MSSIQFSFKNIFQSLFWFISSHLCIKWQTSWLLTFINSQSFKRKLQGTCPKYSSFYYKTAAVFFCKQFVRLQTFSKPLYNWNMYYFVNIYIFYIFHISFFYFYMTIYVFTCIYVYLSICKWKYTKAILFVDKPY